MNSARTTSARFRRWKRVNLKGYPNGRFGFEVDTLFGMFIEVDDLRKVPFANELIFESMEKMFELYMTFSRFISLMEAHRR